MIGIAASILTAVILTRLFMTVLSHNNITLSTLNPFSGERASGNTSPLDNIKKSNENPKLSDTIVMAPKKGKNRLAEPKERDKESAPVVTGSEKDGKSVKSKAEGSAATRGSGDLKSNLPGKPEIQIGRAHV